VGKYLTEEFLSKYNDAPKHMNELSSFVYYRTYSRWLADAGRRETWKETCARAVEYNVSLAQGRVSDESLIVEAQQLFHNMFNLKQFLSGRTLWVGGTEASKKYPLSNFNCAFVEIKTWEDMCDLFYLLLIGTGVGFSCSKENALKLPKLVLPDEIVHKEYEFCGENGRSGNLYIEKNEATITIGDSKERWVIAFRQFMHILTKVVISKMENIKKLTIVYDHIRPKGERLKVFGGTASGHEPLKTMFQSIEKMLRGELDTTTPAPIDGQVRPVHVLDIGNLIGNNVVCGGVRRTAEIFLCDADDWESILAKFGINGIWGEESQRLVVEIGEKLKRLGILVPPTIDALIADPQAKMHLHHRRMSNNSIAFREKPSLEMLEVLFDVMKLEGEPGFVNLESAGKRRPNAKGLNPLTA
jgi:ribonucleoside-triphosphate reductase